MYVIRRLQELAVDPRHQHQILRIVGCRLIIQRQSPSSWHCRVNDRRLFSLSIIGCLSARLSACVPKNPVPLSAGRFACKARRLAVLLGLARPFVEEAPSASCRFHSFTSVGEASRRSPPPSALPSA